ncbi:hypothetical protein CF68_33160 [Cupriavidus sp. SK-4]|uniref:hypothetical protein n=1 Tax=Cupriavidus sp. SK-4 TaxID=574750 RepID=UPI000449220B|nr:hypothetical protein [Cupriavidus sp. SK-4]EYS89536.1 hypothetical protein CF68_33160 [Cupriavidus sp. SK-4]
MEIEQARGSAKDLLKHVLEHQPNLLGAQSGVHTGSGAELAEFCSNFIETYAKYLTTRQK